MSWTLRISGRVSGRTGGEGTLEPFVLSSANGYSVTRLVPGTTTLPAAAGIIRVLVPPKQGGGTIVLKGNAGDTAQLTLLADAPSILPMGSTGGLVITVPAGTTEWTMYGLTI